MKFHAPTRPTLTILTPGAILMSAAGFAQASTSYSSYNTTIGKLGGAAYSGSQTKAISDQDAEVVSSTVGGNYTADVCLVMSGTGVCMGGTATVNDGTRVSLWNVVGGWSVRIKFTDGWQWVNVQVTGDWRADKV